LCIKLVVYPESTKMVEYKWHSSVESISIQVDLMMIVTELLETCTGL